ncbi:MAG: lipopolysaccharide kinase InaA family protein [Pseudomonadota bacterium]
MFWWQVDESFRADLDAIGLGCFEALMDEPVGELLVKGKELRQLRRISISQNGQTRHLFLKRIGREPIGILLRMLVFGRKPCSGPLREKMLIDSLTKAGIPVMRSLAWGEERKYCLPVKGFLLVEGVKGTDLATLYSSSTSSERLLLMEGFGRFVGRLHRKGFFQVVRLKDVFCEYIDNKYSFVLIDRETSKPWVSIFLKRRCINSLARAYRRTLRDGYSFTREENKGFIRHYLNEINDKHLSSKRICKEIAS